MYILDEQTKELKEISETTFSENGLKERYDLQEWIDNNPRILAKELGAQEELLIIQKEFSEFDKTNERLDLLALDKKGNLVIIENKLDDSGKDVVWQALKYVSYCSALTQREIIEIYQNYLNKKGLPVNAEDKIIDYLENENFSLNTGNTQRIILVAKEFRPEVTSTVLWLRSNNIDIQCIKVVPYMWNQNLIIDVDKIIPVPEIEKFTIRVSLKDAEEKKNAITQNMNAELYSKYWAKLLECAKSRDFSLYDKRTGSQSCWISTGAGLANIQYNLVLLKDKIRVELYINKESSDDNKKIFNLLKEEKDIIEDRFGAELTWELLEDKKASRISISSNDSFNRDDMANWDRSIDWHIENMKKFENAIKPSLEKIKTKVSN
ncbi:DUF4268 domain-containing protein [Haemophilus parainfluenzae]|jgi:hypothetical protein|uniref:DUF4268 domain-containing protein n=1 Tax=Haemophilus parainfluenzae TaxID=729 RepID=UPI0018A559FD|nr:DUF4268 domain-containing protein [Haemophilus parainfluenzae]MBF1230649.1 DUF4268 domain-containing protein [Haemophilus parainfluenzae]QOR19180.1 DUF4268 domain-containing protein [Haemophilus parainfluenzae]